MDNRLKIKQKLAEINDNVKLWQANHETALLTKALELAVDGLTKYSYEQAHGFTARETVAAISELMCGKEELK